MSIVSLAQRVNQCQEMCKNLIVDGSPMNEEQEQLCLEFEFLEELELTVGLTIIGCFAFATIGSLQRVQICSTIENIDNHAFINCTNLVASAVQEEDEFVLASELDALWKMSGTIG